MSIQSFKQFSALFLFASALASCSSTSMDVASSPMGTESKMSDLIAMIDQPGPIRFEKHLAARWAVDRSGLINLDHTTSKKAGLEAGPEPIELYVYTLNHPEQGTYLVDSGISERFIDAENNPDLSFIIKKAMNTDALQVVETTRSIIEKNDEPIKGVFLTHIHLDHIMGLTDLPQGTPVTLGPGDAGLNSFENAFSRGTTDRLLSKVDTLFEWDFDTDQKSSGVIDVFGDGSVWAIHSPGHTPGSTAYLVRTTEGPQLLTGDVCHTRWGWVNGVEPGTFSVDQPGSVESLATLQKLVAVHPQIKVHPGHQSLSDSQEEPQLAVWELRY
jgi:glyoxylase-like metal-dependent hydrolase (beta-lactamase superfamily II)